MDQASPPATPGGVAPPLDGRAKRRRLSQVDEQNIIVGDSTRKRKRGAAAQAGDAAYDPGEASFHYALLGASGSGRRGGSPNPATVPARTPEEFEQVATTATILYDKLMVQRDPANPARFLHEHFLELPDPILIPAYYEKIKKPVCLNQIKERLEKKAYNSLLDAKTDMNQIFVNAKRFNAPGSPLFMDAKKLHKNLRANYAYLTGEAPPPEEEDLSQSARRGRRASSSVAPGGGGMGGGDDGDYVDSGGNASGAGGNGQKRGPTLKPWLLRKFDQLVRKTDPNGRSYSDVFRVLPDKRAWPEYYQYITHPISLDNILAKANARKYKSVAEFKQDVETSFGNAMFFNEEYSQIWNDAKTCLDHFTEIMKEVPPKFAPPRKYNTARRRAELENAQANNEAYSEPDRGKSTGPNEEENAESDEDSESGDESDAGSYSGFAAAGDAYESTTAAVAQMTGFANPFANATSIPVLDSYGAAASPAAAFASPALAVQPPLDALTSLASLASSLSPQRPSISLPPNSFNGTYPNQLLSQASASASATTRTGPTSFSPKPLARVPSLGETPVITSFIVSTHPPTPRKIVLENVQARQHSLAVPPLTTRVEFHPSYRRQRPDGTIEPAGSNSGSAEVPPVAVEISARRADSFAVSGERGATPTAFTLVLPKQGLTVAEFKARVAPSGDDEVYRVFISK
ncbi:hypothetical protein JCM11491_006930 [Sporobolomyces phaffii]